jgi:hypothetical protein
LWKHWKKRLRDSALLVKTMITALIQSIEKLLGVAMIMRYVTNIRGISWKIKDVANVKGVNIW